MKSGARFSVGVTLAALLIWPGDADAQRLALEINNGLVTLQADAVPVRQILERWAQIAGLTVINSDALPAGPVTVQFASVPERRALDTLLRDVRGYIVVRRQGAAAGTSIDRLVIAAVTSPPLTQSAQGYAAPAFTPAPSAMAEAADRGDVIVADDSGTPRAAVADAPRPAPAPPGRSVPANPFGITSGSSTPAAAGPGGSDPFGTAAGSSRPGTITPVQTSEPIIAVSSGGHLNVPAQK